MNSLDETMVFLKRKDVSDFLGKL